MNNKKVLDYNGLSTLVSTIKDLYPLKTDFKTVNGENILGSGDIDTDNTIIITTELRFDQVQENWQSSFQLPIELFDDYFDACDSAGKRLPFILQIKNSFYMYWSITFYVVPSVVKGDRDGYQSQLMAEQGSYYQVYFTTFDRNSDYAPLTIQRSKLQYELVSGSNIKTINNQSVLGDGNLTVEGQIVQVDELPTAEQSNLGKIYQYTGADTANYKNGYYYKCVSEVVPTHLVTEDRTSIATSIVSNNHKFEWNFKLLEYHEGPNNLMGAGADTSLYGKIRLYSTTTILFGLDGTRKEHSGFYLVDNKSHKILYNGDNGDYGVDGYILGQKTATDENPIKLFDGYASISSPGAAICEFYELKIWDKTSGDLAYDLVPALDANDTSALYDSINEEYYYPDKGTITYVPETIKYSWECIRVSADKEPHIVDFKMTNIPSNVNLNIEGHIDVLESDLELYNNACAAAGCFLPFTITTHMSPWKIIVYPNTNLLPREIQFYGCFIDKFQNTMTVYNYSSILNPVVGQLNSLSIGYVKARFLSVNNTVSYTPSGQYNPSTKGYTDSKANEAKTYADSIKECVYLSYLKDGLTLPTEDRTFFQNIIKNARTKQEQKVVIHAVGVNDQGRTANSATFFGYLDSLGQETTYHITFNILLNTGNTTEYKQSVTYTISGNWTFGYFYCTNVYTNNLGTDSWLVRSSNLKTIGGQSLTATGGGNIDFPVFVWSTSTNYGYLQSTTVGKTSPIYPIEESNTELKDFITSAYNYAKSNGTPTIVVLNLQYESFVGTISHDDAGGAGYVYVDYYDKGIQIELLLDNDHLANGTVYLNKYDLSDLFYTKTEIDDMIFEGSAEDWDELTEEEKASYNIAIVERSAVLTPTDIANLNSITGVVENVVSDMSEDEAIAATDEIIGGGA